LRSPVDRKVIDRARVRNWRSKSSVEGREWHSPYPGTLHDPQTDDPIDWQERVREITRNLPEGSKVSLTLTIEIAEPGDVAEDDFWRLLKPHTYGHNKTGEKKEEG